MKQRVITSVIIVAVMIAVLSLSWTYVYPAVLSILATVAVFEILRVFRLDKRLFVAIAAYVVAFSLPLVAYFMMDYMQLNAGDYLLVMSLVLFMFMLYLFVVAIFERGRMPFGEFAGAFMITAYVVAAFSSLSVVRLIENVGIYCLGLVLVTAWITDTFAYVVGSLIGKHKLIPEISPKKTVEGSIGGIVFSMIGTMLYGLLISLFTDITPNYIVLAIAGLILSVISQVGDLIASLIKREHNVKDYGSILPGHGGIMDRFDSILSVSTATMIISLIFTPFTLII